MSSGWDRIRRSYIVNRATDEEIEAGRFTNVVKAVIDIQNDPRKADLLAALEMRKDRRNIFQKLHTELLVLAQRMALTLKPAKRGQHKPFWTIIFMFFNVSVFAFMAGEYGRGDTSLRGPRHLMEWLRPNGPPVQFDTEYLLMWGGRTVKSFAVDAEYYRLVTCIFVHADIRHVLSNMAMFVLVSVSLEFRYNCWRVAFVCILSGIGGTLLAAVFDDACAVVVGASGVNYGLMGFFVADFIIFFSENEAKYIMLVLVVTSLGYCVHTDLSSPERISLMSHLGGFICGLLPSLMCMPRGKSESAFELNLPLVGFVFFLVYILVIPYLIFQRDMQGVRCG